MPVWKGTQLNPLERYVLSTQYALSIQEHGLLFDLICKYMARLMERAATFVLLTSLTV